MRELSRSLVLFITVALIALAAVPVIAQQGTQKRIRGSMTKQVGTLSAIDVRESMVTLTLASGATITVPPGKLKIVDRRGGKHKLDVVSSLAAGQNVIVKTRTGPKGDIRSVKVKITG